MPTIPMPAQFNFVNTVFSHGWYQLAPFHYDDARRLLQRILELSDGSVVLVDISDAMHARGDEVIYFGIHGLERSTEAQEEEIRAAVSRMLCLDWDLSGFYAAMRAISQQDGYPDYTWVEKGRAGRLLVSPTVWEELAKVLMTTNTTWAQTRNMVERLCALGAPYYPPPEPSPEEENGALFPQEAHSDEEAPADLPPPEPQGYAFPTPQRIAAMSPAELDEAIRAGYRSAYLHELAVAISEGRLDVEAWYNSPLPSHELYAQIKRLKGFGDYAAGTMMRLLGRFDRIAIDTECRNAYRAITGSETAENGEILRYYEPFGAWRGLAMWMDIIREYMLNQG